ncbi:MAG: hypothetical protein AAGF59_14420 [Pseudomonadota bacterium]
MSRNVSILVLTIFALLGFWIAFWGFSDIRSAIGEMQMCREKVIFDHSSFWFLSLATLPLFLLLVIVPDRLHYVVLILIVLAAVVLPFAGLFALEADADGQGYTFAEPLTVWALIENSGVPANDCVRR